MTFTIQSREFQGGYAKNAGNAGDIVNVLNLLNYALSQHKDLNEQQHAA